MSGVKPRLESARGRQRLVVAHRGASAWHPENSRAAFRAAARVADYVELDVRRTRDDQLVVIHDRTPRRTTNVRELWPERAESPISSFTRAELEELDVGSWFGDRWRGERILQLAEVAELLDGTACGMFVEIKDEDSVGLVAEQLTEVRASWPELRLAVGSIQPAYIEAAHRLLPDLPSGALFLDEGSIATRLEDDGSFCSFAGFRNDVISSGLVARGHALGWQVTHNTNTRVAVRHCLDHAGRHGPGGGVDVTTSDNPEMAVDPYTADDLEAESLPRTASAGAEVLVRGSAGVGYKFSGSADLCLIGVAGDWCEVSFDVTSQRQLTSVLLNCGPDGAVVGLDVDGAPVASGVDTARPSPCRSFVGTDHLLSPGRHLLRIRVEGDTEVRRRAAIDVVELGQTTSGTVEAS